MLQQGVGRLQGENYSTLTWDWVYKCRLASNTHNIHNTHTRTHTSGYLCSDESLYFQGRQTWTLELRFPSAMARLAPKISLIRTQVQAQAQTLALTLMLMRTLILKLVLLNKRMENWDPDCRYADTKWHVMQFSKPHHRTRKCTRTLELTHAGNNEYSCKHKPSGNYSIHFFFFCQRVRRVQYAIVV